MLRTGPSRWQMKITTRGCMSLALPMKHIKDIPLYLKGFIYKDAEIEKEADFAPRPAVHVVLCG